MSRRDLSSVRAVNRVQRLDGSAGVLSVWRDVQHGWQVHDVGRLTPDTLKTLRDEGVRIVRLRRRWHIAEVPLAWFPATPDRRTEVRAAPARSVRPGQLLVR